MTPMSRQKTFQLFSRLELKQHEKPPFASDYVATALHDLVLLCSFFSFHDETLFAFLQQRFSEARSREPSREITIDPLQRKLDLIKAIVTSSCDFHSRRNAYASSSMLETRYVSRAGLTTLSNR